MSDFLVFLMFSSFPSFSLLRDELKLCLPNMYSDIKSNELLWQILIGSHLKEFFFFCLVRLLALSQLLYGSSSVFMLKDCYDKVCLSSQQFHSIKTAARTFLNSYDIYLVLALHRSDVRKMHVNSLSHGLNVDPAQSGLKPVTLWC